MSVEVHYDCIGICTMDPDTGLCEGCGRPWFDDAEAPATDDGQEGESTTA